MLNTEDKKIFLTIKNLNKFKKTTHILKDFSIKVYQGDLHVIVGRNGAGKTTLIRTILNMYKEYSGEIIVDNMQINKYMQNNSISFLADGYKFPRGLTVKEFLFLDAMISGKKNRRIKGEIKSWLKRFGLEDKLNVKHSKLSSGQKQLVLLVKILIEDAKFIIMDEPTSNLDPEFRIMFFNILNDLKKHKTIILSTHQLDEIDKQADAITIIDKGKVIYTGVKPTGKTIKELFSRYLL